MLDSPQVYIPDGNRQERDKYHEIWTKVEEYRNNSPGLKNVDRFMKVMSPKLGSTIIDLGAGECVAGMEFEKSGLRSWYLDITDAAKPKEIKEDKFFLCPLWSNWRFPHSGQKFDYGFCCDVLEHIPPEYTMLCIDRILSNCRVSWLRIDFSEDVSGVKIGETLHMTVRPYEWWLVRLGTLGKVLDARDLLKTGLFVVKKIMAQMEMAIQEMLPLDIPSPEFIFDPNKTKKIELEGSCNTSDEVLIAQVNHNIRLGLRQVKPHNINPSLALLVCGGPSLEETKESLVQAYWMGGKIIAVNGAYNWCIDNNIKPSAMVLLDARETSTRFVEKDVVGCRYLLASQCHPRAFDICKDRDVFIWHACSGGDDEVEIIQEYYFNNTYPVTLGTTVGVRSISLLRMLGFDKIMIFGLDSCWMDNKNHAYEQKENVKDGILPVWLRPEGRDDKAMRFLCSPWMIKQAEDFLELIRERGDMFELSVMGNGLIANILRTGAEIQLESKE